jgi:hypothetical protein
LIRFERPGKPLSDAWQRLAIAPRGSTLLGISFRPPQVAALGLQLQPTLHRLLELPYQLIRLGAYWKYIEPAPGVFDPAELDWQIDAAERAGKQIVLCVGALKTFGYPEYFVPAHVLASPLPEHSRITPAAYPTLIGAATGFITRIVERYKDRPAIVAWQVEHEAVDPLGMEHSWRLDATFVAQEVAAARQADPSRPILMNGYLPVSLPVQVMQWWQTRDQGDSLTAAQHLADVVGIDYYPRHALLGFGNRTVYLDSVDRPPPARLRQLFAWARANNRRLMLSEGQAEPWEAVTTPPNPSAMAMYSCLPEQVALNYNHCLTWARDAAFALDAYLFWGAEYWVLREQHGDPSYMQAFARVVEHA